MLMTATNVPMVPMCQWSLTEREERLEDFSTEDLCSFPCPESSIAYPKTGSNGFFPPGLTCLKSHFRMSAGCQRKTTIRKRDVLHRMLLTPLQSASPVAALTAVIKSQHAARYFLVRRAHRQQKGSHRLVSDVILNQNPLCVPLSGRCHGRTQGKPAAPPSQPTLTPPGACHAEPADRSSRRTTSPSGKGLTGAVQCVVQFVQRAEEKLRLHRHNWPPSHLLSPTFTYN